MKFDRIFVNLLILPIIFVSFFTLVPNTNAKEKIIIAVHGLSNKPPAPLYENWWKVSILEGLLGIDYPIDSLNFKLFYWADMLYKAPMHNDTNFYFDDHFDPEPYTPSIEKKLTKYNWFNEQMDEAWVRAKSFGIQKIYIPVSREFTDMILEKTLRDLSFYFENNIFVRTHDNKTMLVRDAIRRELIKIIKDNEDKEILLIGHSMGSIIAYDVLTMLQESNPEIKIKYLVTVGSPMGIPPVASKMRFLHENKKLKIPGNIESGWYNFSDPNDKAAYDPLLEDNFQKIGNGVEITDELVTNDYISPAGIPNHHKEFGYMRTKKISRLIEQFLNNK